MTHRAGKPRISPPKKIANQRFARHPASGMFFGLCSYFPFPLQSERAARVYWRTRGHTLSAAKRRKVPAHNVGLFTVLRVYLQCISDYIIICQKLQIYLRFWDCKHGRVMVYSTLVTAQRCLTLRAMALWAKQAPWMP